MDLGEIYAELGNFAESRSSFLLASDTLAILRQTLSEGSDVSDFSHHQTKVHLHHDLISYDVPF